MKLRRLSLAVAVGMLTLVASTLVRAEERATGDETALDRYVAKPDASYSWKVINTVKDRGLTTFIVDLKSQTWRTKEEVDRTLWEHWLIVCKPDKVTTNKAFVFIGGGSNGGKAPEKASGLTVPIARATNSVVAELKMIPNQRLEFHGDGHGRSEDDLIAYTWDQFMKTGDDTWPARLPMTKAVVRAMDTITALLASEEGGEVKVDEFVVAGGSKRGWTTWTTAAVDKRVVAIAPLVIDVLNVEASMRHHFAAYGFWAPAVGNYVQHKITERLNDPEHHDLMKLVDPFSYRDRYTMPKFIVNSAGDQFFLPDSSQFYFDDLPGEKHLRYVPNSDHSLGGTDARQSVMAFYDSVLTGTPRPEYSWSMESDGAIRVQTEDAPKEVKLWQATNPKARDFRLRTIGRAYTSTELKDQGEGVYVGKVDEPADGWTAYFVEMTYDLGGPAPLKVTTAVRVVPDVLPHADKDPSGKQ